MLCCDKLQNWIQSIKRIEGKVQEPSIVLKSLNQRPRVFGIYDMPDNSFIDELHFHFCPFCGSYNCEPDDGK